MKRFCVVAPVRTPNALIAVKSAIAIAATSPLGSCHPVSGAKYFANVTAAAAVPPLCETSSSVQPYMKASDG